jgi:hypothetical protein
MLLLLLLLLSSFRRRASAANFNSYRSISNAAGRIPAISCKSNELMVGDDEVVSLDYLLIGNGLINGWQNIYDSG